MSHKLVSFMLRSRARNMNNDNTNCSNLTILTFAQYFLFETMQKTDFFNFHTIFIGVILFKVYISKVCSSLFDKNEQDICNLPETSSLVFLRRFPYRILNKFAFLALPVCPCIMPIKKETVPRPFPIYPLSMHISMRSCIILRCLCVPAMPLFLQSPTVASAPIPRR